MVKYTFDGTAHYLVDDIDGGGAVSLKSPETVTAGEGYKVYNSAGMYHGISFLENILDNAPYYSTNVNKGVYTHTDAQEDFVLSGSDGTQPIAMLISGIWWENEARDSGAFDRLEQKGVNVSELDYGFMPLPKADGNAYKAENGANNSRTVVDTHFSNCFIKANIDADKQFIAKEFVKYCYTDDRLQEFNVLTNTPKALKYTLTDEQYGKLTAFGKDIYEISNNGRAEMVYPFSTSPIYKSYQQEIVDRSKIYTTETKSNMYSVFKNQEMSAKEFFDGIVSKYDSEYWSKYNTVIG